MLTGKFTKSCSTFACDKTEQVKQIVGKYFPEKPKVESGENLHHQAVPKMVTTSNQTAADVIQIAERSRNGELFKALMRGDTSAHNGDDSAADLALCNLLAFYTRKDADLMDQIFRSSGLIRPKWDTKRGASTYGQQTIQRAIADIQAAYGEQMENYTTTAEKPTSEEKSLVRERNKPRWKTPLDMEFMEKFLSENGIKVRQNVISHEIEISGIGGEYNPETIGSELHIILFDRLKKDFRCDKNLVADLLGVIAGKHRFNPVIDMLESITWDKKDRLNDLCGIIGIDPMDKLSKSLLAKWLCQCVAMAYNDPAEPYGADGLLVLQGPQGIGKTTFVSKLCMGRHDLYKLGQYLDTKDKDTSRRCTSAWVVELGEVETTLRSDLERLKAFITAERDEYRLPYGKADQVLTRRTSLIATCNTDRFLIDPTGSRRFWTVPISHIDLDALNEFDFLQLWAEVASWVKGNRQYFRLSREEQAALAERNTEHEKPLKAQMEIEDILEEAAEDKQYFDWKYITVTDFKSQNDSLRGYSVEQVSKALDKIGIQSEKKRIDGKPQRGRLLPSRKYAPSYQVS
ncbi:VapE domain-containing protein [Oscillibacter sp.]|uniref:phage NrS-1 polymerase family protein n=1 Tax=Oscillibacter sp. TaxID=1945593 RepID=UPI00289A1D55|nr:VapE domain-containing protein [Oscillibacter sp.]